MQVTSQSQFKRSNAFTLVEVALAITIVSVVILAAIGLLLPAQRAIDDVLSSDQAARLNQEIEKEFSVLRPGEASATITTPFDKAYNAVKKGKTKDGLLCAFFYRAKLPTASGTASTLPDGRLAPYTDAINDKRVGEDYVVQAAVMSEAAFKATKGFGEALDGKVYVLRMLPLEGVVAEPQAVLPTPFKTLPAATATTKPLDAFLAANGPEAYPLAVLPVAVEFYEGQDVDDPASLYNSIPDPVTNVAPGGKASVKPLLTLNIGFNR